MRSSYVGIARPGRRVHVLWRIVFVAAWGRAARGVRPGQEEALIEQEARIAAIQHQRRAAAASGHHSMHRSRMEEAHVLAEEARLRAAEALRAERVAEHAEKEVQWEEAQRTEAAKRGQELRAERRRAARESVDESSLYEDDVVGPDGNLGGATEQQEAVEYDARESSDEVADKKPRVTDAEKGGNLGGATEQQEAVEYDARESPDEVADKKPRVTDAEKGDVSGDIVKVDNGGQDPDVSPVEDNEDDDYETTTGAIGNADHEYDTFAAKDGDQSHEITTTVVNEVTTEEQPLNVDQAYKLYAKGHPDGLHASGVQSAIVDGLKKYYLPEGIVPVFITYFFKGAPLTASSFKELVELLPSKNKCQAWEREFFKAHEGGPASLDLHQFEGMAKFDLGPGGFSWFSSVDTVKAFETCDRDTSGRLDLDESEICMGLLHALAERKEVASAGEHVDHRQHIMRKMRGTDIFKNLPEHGDRLNSVVRTIADATKSAQTKAQDTYQKLKRYTKAIRKMHDPLDDLATQADNLYDSFASEWNEDAASMVEPLKQVDLMPEINFVLNDVDKSGTLDLQETERAVQSLGCADVSKHTIKKLYHQVVRQSYSVDGLSVDEFKELVNLIPGCPQQKMKTHDSEVEPGQRSHDMTARDGLRPTVEPDSNYDRVDVANFNGEDREAAEALADALEPSISTEGANGGNRQEQIVDDGVGGGVRAPAANSDDIGAADNVDASDHPLSDHVDTYRTLANTAHTLRNM